MKESYTDYLFRNLPAIYREDGKDGYPYRLLSLFGDVLQELEYEIDGLHNYLNPERTRAEFLPWLASWVALALDETWPESRRRELITRIVDLYKWRGTIEGIKTFVEIYTGIRPEIIEPFYVGWVIGVRSTIGEDTKIYEIKEDAHSFSVIVNSFEKLSSEQKRKIMAVVELQKPAHTRVIHFGWYHGFWQVGVRSTIGADIELGG
jgi:phage tail-like protein